RAAAAPGPGAGRPRAADQRRGGADRGLRHVRQVDRAMETGTMLLARLGPPSPRAAHLHLGIARAAIAGARWAEAAASIEVARESAGANAAQIDACAAQVAAGRGRLAEADRRAGAGRRPAGASPAGQGVQPEVAAE